MMLAAAAAKRTATARWTTARRSLAAAAGAGPLVKTALYDLHKELGGDMVPFAGYELPVLYKGSGENGGVMKEHLWCRSDTGASLFDVSHMGQVRSALEALLFRLLSEMVRMRRTALPLLLGSNGSLTNDLLF